MNFVPDMFEYGGLVDLTEYYVRMTEIDRDTDSVFRVRVWLWPLASGEKMK